MTALFVAALSSIVLVSGVNMILLHESRIGGPSYIIISTSKDALESIALLKSDLFQINSEASALLLNAGTPAAAGNESTVRDLTGDIELNFGKLLESVSSPQKREAINRTEAIWNEYRDTLLKEVLPLAAGGDRAGAAALMSGVQARRFDRFSGAIAAMVHAVHADVSTIEEQTAAGIRSRMVLAGLFTLTALIGIAVISYYITTSITRPLRSCVEFARSVAGGRLDVRLTVSGGGEAAELASAMNIMAENLQKMVARVSSASGALSAIDSNIGRAARKVVNSADVQISAVQETSCAVEHINASVREVSAGIEQLAASTAETSASILEMAASIEEVAMNADRLGTSVEEVNTSIIEMTDSIRDISASVVNLHDASSTTASSIAQMDATIREVEKNAMDTSVIAENVRMDAETGKKAVGEAIAGMQAIRASSRITAEVIDNLSLRADDIGTIISVIDEIAEQTTLLALNAAIIAAQAGEHGKGFAVIADEIRELSERTGSSTREIAEVIAGVQNEARRAVEAIVTAEGSIGVGEQLSLHSGAVLEKIVDGVQKASVQISAIARATVEQARGSRSIREAMESVEEMVGQIAVATREHSRGSEQITMAAARMRDLTGQVRTSTREQSRTSSLIAHAAEDISTMIEQISLASGTQSRSSAMISRAVGNIRESSTANSEASEVLEQSIAGLSQQIHLLNRELSGFTF